MTKEDLTKRLGNGTLILDGATGSNLMKAGMPKGICTEQWVAEHPDAIMELQKAYAEAGSDIVCAAITSAVRLVDATVNDVLGLAASVKVHEKSGFIELRLPGGLSAAAESTCQSLLAGLMLYFTELHDEYPENIEVMEA